MNENNKDGLSMAEFQPAEATLQELAAKAKLVDVNNIKQVHEVRIELRDTRISLTKKGKELRDGALQFQKKVIQKEKDLLAIITPEEDRLDAIESADKQKKEMETRRTELPTRIAALKSIGDNVVIADDDLLKMDDNAFNAYRLQRIEAKLVADRVAHEAQIRKEEDERRAKLLEEDQKRRDELAKQQKEMDEKQKLIDQEKARLAGIEEQRQKEEAAKKAEVERLEREAKIKAEDEAKRLQQEDFQAYLKSIGFDKETDKLIPQANGSIEVLRLIGTYKPKK